MVPPYTLAYPLPPMVKLPNPGTVPAVVPKRRVPVEMVVPPDQLLLPLSVTAPPNTDASIVFDCAPPVSDLGERAPS